MSAVKQQKRYGIDVISIYLEETKKFPRLSLEQEADLVEKAKTDGEAREKLLMHTLWVVPAIANRFIGSGLDYIDLIGEGNYGLLRAINSLPRFRNESKFSTYAGEIVAKAILTELRKDKRRIKIKIEDVAEYLEDKSPTPKDAAEKNESLRNLEKAVQDLSPAERSFLKDLFVNDKNVNEIAGSHNATKLRLYRKRNRIFKKIRQKVA